MGLIALAANVIGNAGSSISSTVRDQYLEFFTCDSLGQEVLVKKGAASMKNGKNKGNVDVISNGSKVAVPENTALILVNNGEVVDVAMKPGMYTWDSSTAPSVFAEGKLGEKLKASLSETWERFKFGSEIAQQQRIYFVNMIEIKKQNFGTATPLPYNDPVYRNIYIRLNGMFSFHVEDPVTFFKKQVSSVKDEYTVRDLMGTVSDPGQPRIEFLDNFSEVLNKCGGQDKIMYADLPGEQGRLRKYMADALDEEWLQARGIVVDSVAIGGITPDDKSRERIEQVDQAKMFGSDPTALAAQAVLGQTQAMNTAAGNANGAVTGFAGMGMVGGMGGMNGGINSAFQYLGQQQAAQQAPVAGAVAAGWSCACGTTNTGKFCSNCGQPQPAPAAGWTCACGATNTGKFCSNCGQPQPAGEWICSCGTKNTGKFCSNCGKPQA